MPDFNAIQELVYRENIMMSHQFTPPVVITNNPIAMPFASNKSSRVGFFAQATQPFPPPIIQAQSITIVIQKLVSFTQTTKILVDSPDIFVGITD